MAGVWQPWTDKATGEYVESFAIVTTVANALMMQVHNSKKKMPTILNDDLAWEWMFGDLDVWWLGWKPSFGDNSHSIPGIRMEACTIAKDFREALEPAKEFQYEDVPALELNL